MMMAGLFQVPKNALKICRAAYASVIQVRTYALKYKQPKEEARELGRFRREVRALRKKFREEWQEEQKLKLEAEGAQAAEEARMERLQEKRALKENRKELERMAQEREKALLEREEKLHAKREAGERARLAQEDKLHKRRTQEVLRVQEESEEFVTLENLDQKIQETLDHEMEFNFALTSAGDRIGWSVLRPGQLRDRDRRKEKVTDQDSST